MTTTRQSLADLASVPLILRRATDADNLNNGSIGPDTYVLVVAPNVPATSEYSANSPVAMVEAADLHDPTGMLFMEGL